MSVTESKAKTGRKSSRKSSKEQETALSALLAQTEEVSVVSFDYPSSYSSVFLRLRSLMYDMNFSSIVADEYGIPRQLNENSFAITTSLAASEIEDLIRLKCLDLPDIDFDLNIMTVDDYFRQFYK